MERGTHENIARSDGAAAYPPRTGLWRAGAPPSPAGAGTPSSRSRSRATSLWVPGYVPVRRAEMTPPLPPAKAQPLGRSQASPAKLIRFPTKMQKVYTVNKEWGLAMNTPLRSSPRKLQGPSEQSEKGEARGA